MIVFSLRELLQAGDSCLFFCSGHLGSGCSPAPRTSWLMWTKCLAFAEKGNYP